MLPRADKSCPFYYTRHPENHRGVFVFICKTLEPHCIYKRSANCNSSIKRFHVWARPGYLPCVGRREVDRDTDNYCLLAKPNPDLAPSHLPETQFVWGRDYYILLPHFCLSKWGGREHMPCFRRRGPNDIQDNTACIRKASMTPPPNLPQTQLVWGRGR